MPGRQYSKDYVAEELEANTARRGVWQGNFVKPWNWRRGERFNTSAGTQSAISGECRIKGNINSRGDHIYHVPGSTHYQNTRISTAKRALILLEGESQGCELADARGMRAGLLHQPHLGHNPIVTGSP